MKVKLKLMGKIGWLAADVTGQDRSDPPYIHGFTSLIRNGHILLNEVEVFLEFIHGSSASSYVHHM